MPGQDCQPELQYTITSVGLQGQDSSARLPRQDFQDTISGTYQPGQFLLWYSANFSFHFSSLTKFKRTVVQDFLVWVFGIKPLVRIKIDNCKTVLLRKMYSLSYSYSKVFLLCLHWWGIKNYIFFNLFYGYIVLWFVCTSHMLNFLYSQFASCN